MRTVRKEPWRPQTKPFRQATCRGGLVGLLLSSSSMVHSSTSKQTGIASWQALGRGLWRSASGVNTYLLRLGPGRGLIIDPGDGGWWPHLGETGIHTVEAIVITHAHRDSMCGLYRPGPLAAEFVGDVWIPAGDLHLTRQQDLEEFWRDYQAAGCPSSYAAPRAPLPQRLRPVGADSELLFGDVRLCAVATPGHTRGALSYLWHAAGRQVAFCGDAAHSGATIHELFHLEWDHWTPEGALQAWYGLERLRGNRIDWLLPSHGRIVRREARQLLATLQQRLLRLVSAKTAVAAGEPSRWLDTEAVAEDVDRVLPGLYAFGGNGYALASEDGHALIVDPQLSDLPALGRLLDHTGLVPDVVTASHYHVDHSDALNQLRHQVGAAVWLHPWVAEPLRDRNRYDVPWLPRESITADRRLPEEGRFRWRGFDIGVRPYPGQTRWHCALDTIVQERQVLFSGDNFQPPSRWNGTGGFCAFNGSRFTEGFGRSARVGLDLAPDIICNGHRCLYSFDAGHYEAIIAWSREAEAAVSDLCPNPAWQAAYDPRTIRFEPFVVDAVPGQTRSVDVMVTNDTRHSMTVVLEPQCPEGLEVSPTRRRLVLQPRASRRVRCQVRLSRSIDPGRHILGLDACVDGVMRHETCVALIDVALIDVAPDDVVQRRRKPTRQRLKKR